jgi:hypothetical protein
MSTVRIQVRRGTAAQWTSVNPILAAGELGVESDTNLFKFGNGSSTWTVLSYANNSDVAIGEISQDAINTALTVGSGLTKTYNDGANTITIAVDASYFNELAQDAVNTALTAGTGISKTYDDSANTLTVAVDTTVIADRSWVSGQITTLSNTVDNGFLEVADRGAQGGVASLDQNTLVPQAQILEPVQDIVAAMTNGGRGLNTSYNDTTGALTLTPAISGRNGVLVEDVAGNGIGLYLDNTITAHTKLTTPLVEAGTVSATTVTTGDITISGNMTVNGTTTTVNSTNVSYDDPMVYMGEGNQSNALDLGFVAAFNNGTYQHSGLVRDASENHWVLFSGVVSEPTTVVDFTTYTKDNLVVGALNATAATIGSVTNSEIQHLGGVTSAIQTQINTINTNATTAASTNQAALDLKLTSATAAGTYAPIASPTFTGTVIGVTKSMVGLGNVDNTADSAKPISDAAQTAIDLKAPLASPALTGTPTAPTATVGTSTTQVATTAFVASTYAPLDGPTFTGSVSGITKTMVGLSNVDNTTDAGKPVSSAAQTALDLKADLASPTFTGTVSGITKTMVGLSSVDNTADADKPVSTAAQAALDLKLASATAASTYAPIASPTFTGTVAGITSTMVGLGNVDNTADTAKPVSTAAQAALDLKANLASPTFTGTVTLPTGTVTSGMILDGAIVNADINASAAIAQSKISGLTDDLSSKLALAGGTMTGALTLSGAPTSDLHAATKLYVDNVAAGINFHEAVHVASVTNSGVIYNNGTNGAGATLTADTDRSISTIDGESIALGERILMKNQTDAKQNGIYVLTAVGSVSAPWVMTRATDADNNPTGEMKSGDFTFVQKGTTNGSVGYINNSTTNPIVIGTDNISYTEFNAAKAVVAGSGLTEATPGTISVATGGVTSAMIADGTIVDADVNASAAIAQSKISGLTSDLAAKAPLASPTFTGTVTVAAAGVAFTDGTQTREGVPSRTTISQKTASYTLSALTERDSMIEMNSASAITLTVPTNATVAWPVGTSIDVLRVGAGAVDVAAAGGVTINATPGLKLRAQWSSATLIKRATDTWVLVGDLSA